MEKREGSFGQRFRHRYDVLARHPLSEEVVDGVEDLDEAETGHVVKRFLDDGYLVDVRDRRTGRVNREIPVSEIGILRRKRFEAEQQESD